MAGWVLCWAPPVIARDVERSADQAYLQALEAFEGGSLRQAAGLFESCAQGSVAQATTSEPDALLARANVMNRFVQEAHSGEDPAFRTAKYASALAARAHTRLGDLASEEGRLDAARLHYEEALRLDGEYPMAHADLGSLLVAVGEYERGIELLERARSLAPAWAPFRAMAAEAIARSIDAREQSGEIGAGEAEVQYVRALSIDAYNQTVQILLGRLLIRRGDRQKGLFVLARAAEQQRGGNLRACIAYAEALVEDAQGDRAIEYARRACSTPDAPPESHRALGSALAQEGRCEEALAELYQAAASMPRDALSALHLGKTYQRLGWTDHARRAFQCARGLDSNGSDGVGLEATYRLGYVHFQRGDLSLAASLLGDAIDSAPAGTRWLDHARDCRRRAQEVLAGLPGD